MQNSPDDQNPAPPTRRAARRTDTFREIHALAWRQMNEHGPSSLSLREISRAMRMSSAAVYRYYPSRAALVSALMVEAFQDINRSMRAGAVEIPADDPAGRIRSACRAYRAWALHNPEKYALIYGSPIADYQPDWETLLSPAKEGLEIMLDLARQAWETGHVQVSPLRLPLTAEVEGLMAEILARRAYGVPPALLYAVITGWTRLHGMVSLEVFGHIHPLIADLGSVVDLEIDTLLSQIGLLIQDPKR